MRDPAHDVVPKNGRSQHQLLEALGHKAERPWVGCIGGAIMGKFEHNEPDIIIQGPKTGVELIGDQLSHCKSQQRESALGVGGLAQTSSTYLTLDCPC